MILPGTGGSVLRIGDDAGPSANPLAFCGCCPPAKIGADIPEKYAYEGSDVLSLDTIGGCYNIMPETYQCSVCGRRGHEAWFDSQEELESSDNISGGYVTKSFYEKFKMLLFSAIDDRWFVLKANIVKMAIEVKESGYEKHNRIRLKK